MTLHDLWMIIRRYYKAVIFVPVLCAMLLAGAMTLNNAGKEATYTAVSKLTVTDSTGLVGTVSLANLVNVSARAEVESVLADVVDAKAVSDNTTQTVEFTVTAGDSEQAVEFANGLAEATRDAVQVALIEQGAAFLDAVNEVEPNYLEEDSAYLASGVTAADRAAAMRSCAYAISEATPSETTGGTGLAKYAIVGFLGGLFAVICGLALMNTLRRPIKDKIDIFKITDVPVLSEGDSPESADRLWINICFTVDSKLPKSICLLPISGEAPSGIETMLKAAIASNPIGNESKGKNDEAGTDTVNNILIDVQACDSIRDDMTGAIVAHDSEATVLVVRPWTDKAADMLGVLEELRLAKARVVGIALA